MFYFQRYVQAVYIENEFTPALFFLKYGTQRLTLFPSSSQTGYRFNKIWSQAEENY